jgi:hypothetical protein
MVNSTSRADHRLHGQNSKIGVMYGPTIWPELEERFTSQLDERIALIPPIDRLIGLIAVALLAKKHRKHDGPLRRPLRWSARDPGVSTLPLLQSK